VARRAAWLRGVRAVLIAIALAWSAVPILLVVMSSFKQPSEIFAVPPSFWFTPTFDNYAALWREHRAFFRAAHTVDRSGVYALRFDTDHGPIEVLWNAGWSPQTVSIPWTGATAVIVQMDGTVIGEADVRYHHAIWLLPADGKPVYLVVRSPTPRLLAPGPLLHPPPPPPPRRPPPTRKSGRPPRRARVPIARRRAPPPRTHR